MGIGLGMMSLSHPTMLSLSVGAIFAGLGYGVMQPIVYDKAATNAPPELSTLALSIVMAVNYLAILVAPFIIDGLGRLFHTSSYEFPFMFNAIATLLLAIIAAVTHNHSRLFGSDD